MMTANRYLVAARISAFLIDPILTDAGIDIQSNQYYLTETDRGDAWLFVLFNSMERQSVEKKLTPEILRRLGETLRGRQITLCRRQDLCLAVLLSPGLAA
jgi:hypothetical protein